jgi:ATPase subunit of ABC transporter with duplicated ATPase domains
MVTLRRCPDVAYGVHRAAEPSVADARARALPDGERELMATVTFDHVTKCFGDVVAVNDVDLQVRDGEFIVLVGPLPAARRPACG